MCLFQTSLVPSEGTEGKVAAKAGALIINANVVTRILIYQSNTIAKLISLKEFSLRLRVLEISKVIGERSYWQYC
jgi:hypothetical protein